MYIVCESMTHLFVYNIFLQAEDSPVSDIEAMKLFQRVNIAEEEAKKAKESFQALSEEKETLQAKFEAMNKQLQKLEEWHRLTVEHAQQTTSSEATAQDAPQEETVTVSREKHSHLKKNFLLLTDRVMKIEKSHQQLLDKLEDRDKQVKELQLKAKDSSVVPRTYESLSLGEETVSSEELSHNSALNEIDKLKKVNSELRNQLASLQSQVSSFGKTAAEHSKMTKHGIEQSKTIVEWRRKCEAAEVCAYMNMYTCTVVHMH